MTNPADIINELASLKKFFVSSQADLAEGRVTSMMGIDMRIADLCKKVQVSQPEDQKIYLPELTALIELMNSYERSLRDFQALQLAEAARIADAIAEK